jgi:hypothetical protein
MTYDVRRTDILGGQWTTIGSVVASTNFTTFIDASVSGTNSCFYRVKYSSP